MKSDTLLIKLEAKPGEIHRVSDFDPEFTANLGKKEAEKLLEANVKAMIELQGKLYAHNRYAVLLVFQAMDAAGKDGTIKHVMSGLNPQGTQVFSFKSPSDLELDHDYFWRTYRCMPQRGNFGIFNRSYYEEVLIVRVHPEFLLRQRLPDVQSLSDVNNDFWVRRYRQINDLEQHLVENGTIVIKFFLNVSKEQFRFCQQVGLGMDEQLNVSDDQLQFDGRRRLREGLLQADADQAVGAKFQPLVAQGRPQDVAQQRFAAFRVGGPRGGVGVEREPTQRSTAWLVVGQGLGPERSQPDPPLRTGGRGLARDGGGGEVAVPACPVVGEHVPG